MQAKINEEKCSLYLYNSSRTDYLCPKAYMCSPYYVSTCLEVLYASFAFPNISAFVKSSIGNLSYIIHVKFSNNIGRDIWLKLKMVNQDCQRTLLWSEQINKLGHLVTTNLFSQLYKLSQFLFHFWSCILGKCVSQPEFALNQYYGHKITSKYLIGLQNFNKK